MSKSKEQNLRGTAPTLSGSPSRRQPNASETSSGKGRILLFKARANSGPVDPNDPEPLPGCSRPCTYILDEHRDNILAAARRGQHYRSIAAQYGVSALDIWRIVAGELQARRIAA